MLSKIVQESVRNAEIEFYHSNFCVAGMITLKEKCKCGKQEVVDFVLSSQISLLEAELDRKKGMIIRYEKEDEIVFGYNKSVFEDITYLQEQIVECKKLLK